MPGERARPVLPAWTVPAWAVPAWAVLAAAAAGTDLVGGGPLRAALAGPLVLVLPGHALLGAAGLGGLDRPTRAALAVGLSLAVAALAGLVLGLFGLLTAPGWALALGAVTLLAWSLERGRPRREHVAPSRAASGEAAPRLVLHRELPPRARLARAGMLALAGLLAWAALAGARQGALAHREYAFAEFWMVPSDASGRGVVTLGVRSFERAESTFEVDLVAGGTLVGRWPAFRLAPGETRTIEVALPAAGRASRGEVGAEDKVVAKADARVEAWLYKDGVRDAVYRKVWVHPRAAPSSDAERD